MTHDDRYLAFADLLFDVARPGDRASRHRALVRIEDVGPDADPAELRAIADYLYSKKVPFTRRRLPAVPRPEGREQRRQGRGLHAARSGRRWSPR